MTTNYTGGFPTGIKSPRLESAVIKWTLHDLISRSELLLAGGVADAAYEVGTVFGKITRGAQTVGAAAAFTGNATNATVSAPTAVAGASEGKYAVLGLTSGATGAFAVFKPDGTLDGIGKVGTAYDGTVKFTVTDGTNHLAVGDGWSITITYAAGSGKYVPVNASATDGSQYAAAILYARAFVPAGVDMIGGGVTKFAAVIGDALIWPDNSTTDQIAAWLANLAGLGISSLTQV